ncbi:MAG TPA: universal stress protein [bacterium]|nr:universal stress protein [bacterium]
MIRKLLVGYDGSDGSKLALKYAINLAKLTGASLRALWVRGSLPHYPETVDEIEEEKSATDRYWMKLEAEIREMSAREGVEVQTDCRAGHPAKAIAEYAEEAGVDLIVLGNRGHSGLWGRFLGHTADRISENAPCSVLIVRGNESREKK